MADVKGMLADPEFQRLDVPTQKQALGQLDPELGKLSDDDYGKFVDQVGPVTVGGTARAMAGQAGRALGAGWDTLKSIPGSLIRMANPATAAQDLISGFGASTDAIGRTRAAFGKGDYPEAAKSAVGAIPLLGPQAEQITREATEGQIPEAIGHAGALALLPKAVEAAPAVGGAISRAATRLGPAARAAGPEIGEGLIKGGAAAVGEHLGLPGSWFLGAGAAKNLYGGIKAGINALRTAPAVAEDTALLDKIAQGYRYKDFVSAPADAQQTIRGLAGRINGGAATPEVPAAPSPSAPIRPYVPPPPGYASSGGRTVQEQIQNDLRLRREAEEPSPISARVPIWTGAEPPPAATQPEIAPIRSPLPSGRTPGPIRIPAEEPSPTLPEIPPEVHGIRGAAQFLGDRLTPPTEVPVPKAFLNKQTTGLQNATEQSNRSAVASKLARALDAEGITADQIDALRKADPAEHKLFWNNAGRLPGISSQPHYSPTPDTIERAMTILRTRGMVPREGISGQPVQ